MTIIGRVTVLGSGLIGRTIVGDLLDEPELRVRAVDSGAAALARLPDHPRLEPLQADLLAAGVLEAAVADADLVVSALPGFVGFEALRRVIEAGKDLVDISFFPEDPFALDSAAKQRGVVVVVDCGVAPGLCNLLAGRVARELERVDSYSCYVGGLPEVRRKPFEYAAVFSPADVIEEYTRPARMRVAGREVVRAALSEIELLDLPGIGTLEAFNTDGLRSLLSSLDAPDMKEKTLRYPGHAELMRTLRDAGFFDLEPIEVGGASVRPRDVSSKLLFDRWHLPEGEADVTVMRVEMRGATGGERRRVRFDLLDRYDQSTATTSMARTTAFTCTGVARLLLAGLFEAPGVHPPERLGADRRLYGKLLAGLAARGVRIERSDAVEEGNG